MTRILMTIGPQGAGKSTFCESIMSDNIDGVAYASRDRFLVGRYGKAAWDPYSGAMHYGMKEFYRHVAHLASKNRIVLLECFCADQRHFSDLRSGIFLETNCSDTTLDYEALWFTTPDHLCAQWYVKREIKYEQTTQQQSQSLSSALYASKIFRIRANRLVENFVTVWHIDPRQLTLFPHSEILGLRVP
jgi:hypothetical protein